MNQQHRTPFWKPIERGIEPDLARILIGFGSLRSEFRTIGCFQIVSMTFSFMLVAVGWDVPTPVLKQGSGFCPRVVRRFLTIAQPFVQVAGLHPPAIQLPKGRSVARVGITVHKTPNRDKGYYGNESVGPVDFKRSIRRPRGLLSRPTCLPSRRIMAGRANAINSLTVFGFAPLFQKRFP